MNNPPKYDFIIAGSGCAGLSLLVHLIRSGNAKGKSILVADRELKNRNDRTWCFWERGQGVFEQLVRQSWRELWFRSFTLARLLPLEPYRYKLIRGIDFYEFCLSIIHDHPEVEIIRETVDEVGEDERGAFIRCAEQTHYGQYVFNSILFEKPVKRPGEYWLLQHFRGWMIRTPRSFFNPDQATLMDFRVSQEFGPAFVYVMPFSETEALVEYTLFSRSELSEFQYEEGLRSYLLDRLELADYEVLETEAGVIPMTNHLFSRGKGNLIHIGTAGGQTRGSTGYTFQFIQKQSAKICNALTSGRHPLLGTTGSERRAAFYDSVLLDILYHNRLPGHEIFTRLFARNDPRKVLKFLDGETSLREELKLVSSLPTLPFLKAALSVDSGTY